MYLPQDFNVAIREGGFVLGGKEFVSSGAIQRLQDIEAEPGSKLKEFVDTINSCYPEEIVRYYSPGYSEQLMEKIDNYSLPGGN